MKTLEENVLPAKSRRMVVALVMAALGATLSIALSPAAARADGGRR
jgi:hypothetical protein